MSWMHQVAEAVESRLRDRGIRLTLGGEPTFVPLHPDGPEWSVSADGPTKLPLARCLAADLQQRIWPGSTLIYCPGKRYDGEVNPRWALRLIHGVDGQPPVRWPRCGQPGREGPPLAADGATAWLEAFSARLGVTLRPVPLNDPLDPDRRVWAAPLTASLPEANGTFAWQAEPWNLAEEHRQLSGAPGPAGLRLPLEHLPDPIPRQVLTLECDGAGWELFLPPLTRRPLEVLLQAVADSLEGLAAPRLSGVLPFDTDGHWQVLGLTADPGVLEINLPVCHGWSDYDSWLRQLEQAGERVGLRSWKPASGGRQEGTGGGNHLLWGGPSLDEHPFFRRPGWLAGILRFWQHHPALAYLFTGSCVGSASQAPRPDEAIDDPWELELAYRALEQADEGWANDDPRGDHRGLIGETLRHLHADRSGNNHRSEISFDKFWNPGMPAGCLGLVEFRALESLPKVEWSSAIALLWSTIAAHLLTEEARPRGLVPWGQALHDRQLLPSQLWADLEAILALLAADGFALDPTPYRQLWDWRFPTLLQWESEGVSLEVRQALEPWPLICDFPREGGFTSRFIDASMRRLELTASPEFGPTYELLVNDKPLSMPSAGPWALRYRHHRLYPCFHPAIAPHLPLQLTIRRQDNGDTVADFRLQESDLSFRPMEPETAPNTHANPNAPAWSGPRPGLCTVDLRQG